MTIDFDDYLECYKKEVNASVSFTGQDVNFYTEVKAQRLLQLAERHLGNPGLLNVLDVGCGSGITDSFLSKSFKMLSGVDLSNTILKKAAVTNPSVHYQVYDGMNLPFSNCSFDLIFIICVLHHVFPGNWNKLLMEMKRVTKINGLVVIFEHNPFNPLTRLAVHRCEFDRNANLLKKSMVRRLLNENGFEPVEDKYFLFTPYRGSIFLLIDRIIGFLPLGAQYYAAARKTKRQRKRLEL